MLVKELRQGMRTNLFTAAFILLQAFMILCAIVGSQSRGEPEVTSGFFWTFVIAALLVVMPIRGFSALVQENKLNTMDLIQLTKLSAWRIAFGKWASLVAQSLLLVCGVLPYLVMRYFFGGIDVVTELAILFWVVVASMLLTAVTVGMSAFQSVLLRSAVAVGLLFLTVSSSSAIMMWSRYSGGPGGAGTGRWWFFLSLFVVAAYGVFFFLDLGASRIAPDAENFATRKRSLGLLFMTVLLLSPLLGMEREPAVALAVAVACFLCLDALTERPSVLPSVLRPFAGRFWARPLAPLLLPGWHTGMLYLVAVVAAFALLSWVTISDPKDYFDLEGRQVAAGIVGTLTFPLIVIQLFFHRRTHTQTFFNIYVVVQCCVAVIGLFLTAVSESTPLKGAGYLLCPIPFVSFLAAMNDHESDILLILAIVFTGIAFLMTLWRGWPLFRQTNATLRHMRREEGASRADR
ncbi:MAG: hypothetical protein KDM91_00245 [Verrucomicrobiae bacterium]|nr:hypothetical protein [Verrucomicrobiae bacterium]